MTMLDQKVAQIYVSTDSRTQGNTYNSCVLALARSTAARTNWRLGQTAMVL
jgi:hypothetical protein